MKQYQIVHFVYFETVLDKEQFLFKWEEFTRSVNCDQDVILQQSERNGVFSYVAQHRGIGDQFQFVFEKARRSSKQREVYIKAEQMGGYSLFQSERMYDTRANESKVLAFVINPNDDLDLFRQIGEAGDLNIYEPYYENCRYTYILEFFVKTKFAPALVDELAKHKLQAGMYKRCALQLF